MKMSDEALEELISDYSNSDEKTMIVVFGDHQPTLNDMSEELLFDEESDTIDRYTTPFAIWANYDIKGKKIGAVSANYLPFVILDAANYPLTPFWELTKATYESFPVLTTQGIIDKDGNYYKTLIEVDDSTGVLREYAIAQYYNMFDNKDN